MPYLVSASRRSDIPQFFGDWFAARRRDGFCEARSVYGRRYRVSLLPDDVTGYLFWTKFGAPFEGQLRGMLNEGVAAAFQFTLNGYGPAVEANIPPLDETIASFLRISRLLPSPACIQWRYDPVVVSDAFPLAWHRANFSRIAAALEGATRVCNVSVVEPYAKVVRRMGEGVAYRAEAAGRHAAVARRSPGLRRAGAAESDLLAEMAGMAKGHGIELRGCCSPELALPGAACCGAEPFEPYGLSGALLAAGGAPSRPGCRCLRSKDIGSPDSCPGGCRYCYATS
jgi:hypothetical protein